MRKLMMFALLAALGCGDDDTTDPGDGAGNGNDNFTVSVTNFQFNPANLSVPVGSTVTWQWNSGTEPHNVTFEDGAAGSGNKATGTFARTFSATGDYAYECTLHSGMTGLVSVTASTTGGSGAGGGGAYP